MLVTTKYLLDQATKERKAIGAFNVTGLENIISVLQAAEELNEPVILEFAQVHEEENIIPLDIIGPIMIQMAKKAKVDVAVHLDHAVHLEIIEKALNLGFTSIMFDGSALNYDVNINYTKEAVKLAMKFGATVEAEIGKMAGITLNNEKITENRTIDRSNFTNPIIAKEFVRLTGVDCLACAFGTVHGEYHMEPKLDFELIKELNDTIGVPIVMHGGSGLKVSDIRKAIQCGVRKINYYTYMAKAGGKAVYDLARIDQAKLFHDYANLAILAMKEDVKTAIQTYSNKGVKK